MNWETFQNWFLSLGADYGVNPFIFGAIYIGAIPFFTLSVGWLIRNYLCGKSINYPVEQTGTRSKLKFQGQPAHAAAYDRLLFGK